MRRREQGQESAFGGGDRPTLEEAFPGTAMHRGRVKTPVHECGRPRRVPKHIEKESVCPGSSKDRIGNGRLLLQALPAPTRLFSVDVPVHEELRWNNVQALAHVLAEAIHRATANRRRECRALRFVPMLDSAKVLGESLPAWLAPCSLLPGCGAGVLALRSASMRSCRAASSGFWLKQVSHQKQMMSERGDAEDAAFT